MLSMLLLMEFQVTLFDQDQRRIDEVGDWDEAHDLALP